MAYPKGFSHDGYPLCPSGFKMRPRGNEQYRHGYVSYTYFKDSYRKFGPTLPNSNIYTKLNRYRTGIERTFGLVKENRYRMENSNFYKGIDNVAIHAVEHDIVLTQDIIFDYAKSGKISSVLNL